MNGNFFKKKGHQRFKNHEIHIIKKNMQKVLILAGYFFPGCGIKPGTIQLTLKNNH